MAVTHTYEDHKVVEPKLGVVHDYTPRGLVARATDGFVTRPGTLTEVNDEMALHIAEVEGGDEVEPESEPEEVDAADDAETDDTETDESGEDEPSVTEAARAHAEELGVDLTQVEGTGKDGTITKADVAAAASGTVIEGDEDK